MYFGLISSIRYGLVVRIPGSHPGGPGSIPGIGIIFLDVRRIDVQLEVCFTWWLFAASVRHLGPQNTTPAQEKHGTGEMTDRKQCQQCVRVSSFIKNRYL